MRKKKLSEIRRPDAHGKSLSKFRRGKFQASVLQKHHKHKISIRLYLELMSF